MKTLTRMKAITYDTYGGPEVLRVSDVEPPTVAEDKVLIRVHAAGVDPGAWHMMTGLPLAGRLAFGLSKPKNPVLGMDVSGTVVAVGANVTKFVPGDEVFGVGAGSFAEYTTAKERQLAKKPAALSFEQAAAVAISSTTALQALRDAGRLTGGERVLVIGASGGVGSFAVQIAKALGAASVTGVCSTRNVDRVRALGADEVIDYTRENLADRAHDFDLVIDIAGSRPLADLRRMLAPKGTLVLVGGEGGGRMIGAVSRNLQSLILSPFISQRLTGLLALTKADDLEVVRELIEQGKVVPLMDRTYPLEQAAEAIRYLAEGHSQGKIALSVSAG
ncbi:NAD(P)-dependent alcohol dehydrogenase [Diaminobutyricimonas sp. TR449]|uniref:NAD(P)-dependent alcohol dehydrogenase n=1 Tax=Diaminobutyricimonas sp. TR449 TaxID=2708076 RepID=UPI0014239E84|nr:NAD(P)-dependent alcohol dehydrogenase [Diaminobutyricimonas sp. TR449]